jgi:outer membrane lipoprotein SlyB
VVGNKLENNQRAAGPGMYQIGVRLDNGTYMTVTQDSAADLGIGNRVRIDGGRVYRY